MPPFANVDEDDNPWLLWHSYESGDRVVITNAGNGDLRATIDRTEDVRVMKGIGKTYQTVRVYMTTDKGKKTWRVARNIRYVNEDDTATVYSTESETTIDLTGDI